MAISDDFARLENEIGKDLGDVQTEITTFPSGAVDLLVRVGGRAFELVYTPSQKLFCVDELEADAAFNSGYRYGFQDFDSAKAKLLCLLEEAQAAATEDRKPPLADAKATTR